MLEIDQTAKKRLAQLMPQMVKAAGITEQLKATDQMRWVGLMNTVKAQVEEIIFAELIQNLTKNDIIIVTPQFHKK